MQKTLEELENERWAWSQATFPLATAQSSLEKLKVEIVEVEQDLAEGKDPTEEYVDCIKCIFDSARRAGISIEQITAGFEKKLAKNKARTWSVNPDNSYSHIK